MRQRPKVLLAGSRQRQTRSHQAQFAGERCTVSVRVDAFEAKVNERVVANSSKAAHGAFEDKIAEVNRDFESIRGKTCNLAVKDLKALMASASSSLIRLGPASNFTY